MSKVVITRDDEKYRLCFSRTDNKEEKKSKKNKRKTRRREVMFHGEIKDMKKLSTNDEAFHLSRKTLREIIRIISSRKTPTPETYRHWDEYALSFYLKMCTCFRVDYKNLEATPEPPVEQQATESQPLPERFDLSEHLSRTGVGFVLKTLSWAEGEHFEPETQMKYKRPVQIIKPAIEDMSFDEYLHQVADAFEIRRAMPVYNGAFDFGSYSSETGPDRIPYHLYLLIKEAVYVMSRTDDWKDLKMVEHKICFFMTYFHSHVPRWFRYNRLMARCYVDSYDGTHDPRYKQDDYTLYHYSDFLMYGFDPRARLLLRDIVNIMNIIHSRKTPTFWGMDCDEISFYCKLCSCFRIEYNRLEDASEDDVCLMNMRRNG